MQNRGSRLFRRLGLRSTLGGHNFNNPPAQLERGFATKLLMLLLLTGR